MKNNILQTKNKTKYFENFFIVYNITPSKYGNVQDV